MTRSRLLLAIAVLALLIQARVRAAAPLPHKPLNAGDRAALLSLLEAVDRAQESGVPPGVDLPWETHVLKSAKETGYVAFRLALSGLPAALESAAMYVRVVSRHDDARSAEGRSRIREWIADAGLLPPRQVETVVIGPGEMPVGGPAVGSARQSILAPAEASTLLALQRLRLERGLAAAEAEKRRAESKQRDPYVFPFEEYYFFDVKSRLVERAVAVPPGEYDVFVGITDRARVKTTTPTVVRHAVTVPDFWNLELRLSSLILASEVRTRPARLAPKAQIEHPYTFGLAEVVPVPAPVFTTNDVLSVVYQVCNYGAPDVDVTAEYDFYQRVNGRRTLFNRTLPQELTDDDLPPPTGWETQGFAMQRVPLRQFPPGEYELEVDVRDRLTRRTAKQTTTFTVK